MSNPVGLRLARALVEYWAGAAIEISGTTRTYGEVKDHCAGVSRWLGGAPDQTTVIIAARKHYDIYVGIIACFLSDVTFVPISPHLPYERSRSIMGKVRPFAILVSKDDLAWAESLVAGVSPVCRVQVLEDLWKEDATSPDDCLSVPSPLSTTNSVAYILFTSGTTGEPKGIPISFSNVEAYLDGISGIISIFPNDRCSQLFELSFDLSIHDILVTLSNGACLCVPTDRDKFNIAGYLRRARISVSFLVPSAIRAVADACRKGVYLEEIRLALFCGEALMVADAQKWIGVAPNAVCFNLYGPTETTIAISYFSFDSDILSRLSSASVPIGLPFRDQTFDIIDDQLCISGSQVFQGYLDPALDVGAFTKVLGSNRSNSYRTGDLVERISSGFIFKGRLDGQVKINGFRVELLDIEASLEACLSNSVVYATKNVSSAGQEGIHVFVYFPAGSLDEVKDAIMSRLPNYMHPQKITLLEKAYYSNHGKKDRNAAARAANEV